MSKSFREVAAVIGIAAGLFLGGVFVAGIFSHPPGDSQDWAAWVQAVGSILAIVVAILVVRHQSISDRRLEQARRDLDRIHRFESVRAVMAMVYTITTTIKTEIEEAEFEELALNSLKFLEGIDQALKAFPVIDIPNTEQTVMILTLYNSGPKLGAAISRFCSEMIKGGIQKNKKHLEDILNQINNIRSISKASKDRCESSIRKLQVELPVEMSYLMKEEEQ